MVQTPEEIWTRMEPEVVVVIVVVVAVVVAVVGVKEGCWTEDWEANLDAGKTLVFNLNKLHLLEGEGLMTGQY
jgi:hypothetical protein